MREAGTQGCEHLRLIEAHPDPRSSIGPRTSSASNQLTPAFHATPYDPQSILPLRWLWFSPSGFSLYWICAHSTKICADATEICTDATDLRSLPTEMRTVATDLRTGATNLRFLPTEMCTDATDLRFLRTETCTDVTDLRFPPTEMCGDRSSGC
jgi:hypothetical protein